IMASHVERMKKSPCYLNSGKMSCITCHDPHVSVKFTPRKQYLDACNSCHGGKEQVHCTELPAVRAKNNDDCVSCHMPHNGSIDIPHVAVTDHFIRAKPVSNQEQSRIRAFLGLKSFNNDKVDPITTGRAYMEFFERYNPNKGLIDSALFYLDKEKSREQTEKQNRDYIRAYFLLNDYQKVVDAAGNTPPESIRDAWAAYRIGESWFQLQQPEKALPWYKRAADIWKFSLDFQSKYGICLLSLGRQDEASKVFRFILAENENHVAANTNLGFVLMQQGQQTMAFEYIRKAQLLDPDHEQNLINLAVWYHNNKADAQAKKTLLHLIRRHPQNAQAKAMLADLP
ncbi:MAG: tetratricopeptide repeat protein, partial [Sphingobacteriales bacterium]